MILDYDPFTGVTRKFEYDHVTDQVHMTMSQDCTDIIKDNERQVIEADHSQQIKNDWIRYARIPEVVIEQWRRDYGVDFYTTDPQHWKLVMAMINDREFRKVKTTTIHHDR